jgi:phosphopantothenoylcysteine decarboxylase / phosphopantothenate---cysteine ligase
VESELNGHQDCPGDHGRGFVTGLFGAHVLLGVTGGIAAYKSVDLASKLVQAGATIDVILTAAGSRFVGPASFEAITKRPVHSDVFEPWRGDWHGHITLGHQAHVIVVAPATANSIAKLAHGIADDMFGSAALSSSAPLLLAPAMEHEMYHHAATKENLEILRSRGAVQVGPERGRLASGEVGDGRMAEPTSILGAIRLMLGAQGPLAGRRVVVTAGGTQEPIDPIRFIGNRSSGLMGYSIAQALIDQGAMVDLVSGPTSMRQPYGACLTPVRTADEMMSAVMTAIDGADALIMTAAVADYRPTNSRMEKIKKSEIGVSLSLDLTQNPDILAKTQREGLIRIGFAAETSHLIDYARQKLEEKQLDLVVANNANEAIGQPENEATLLNRDGSVEHLSRMPKPELAAIVVDRLRELLSAQ